MSNFGFLANFKEYAMFAAAAIEAEKVYATSPAMCAVGCRKALELAVKWVYAADNTITMPYKDNLQSLIHEPSFRFAVDSQTWGKMPFIIRLGNLSMHTEKAVNNADALLSLQSLFEFIEWVDYCYGADYVERHFDPALIPAEKVIIDTAKIKEQASLIEQKDSEIKALQEKIAAMSATLTAEKETKQESRHFVPDDLSEFRTRKIYIDVDLKSMGSRVATIRNRLVRKRIMMRSLMRFAMRSTAHRKPIGRSRSLQKSSVCLRCISRDFTSSDTGYPAPKIF